MKMNETKKNRKILNLSIMGFFIMSVSILLLQVSDKNGSEWTYIVGLMFWLGLLGGVVLFAVYSKNIKKFILIANNKNHTYKNRKIGLITFFSNKYASIADSVMILSALLFVILIIFTDGTSYICLIALALLAFSFSMHCVLNSKSLYIDKKMNRK